MGASTMSCHAVAPPRDEALGTSYRTVAVVGPPNSGKTTLFNRLTKLRQKVGNFPGVTVEHHTGYIRDAQWRRGRADRSARRLQPHSEIRRREGCSRRPEWQHAGNAASGRDHPGAQFHESAHAPGAGGTRHRARPSDAGAAQHGRRTAQAGRPCRRVVPGA